jgi:hypothetical protein
MGIPGFTAEACLQPSGSMTEASLRRMIAALMAENADLRRALLEAQRQASQPASRAFSRATQRSYAAPTSGSSQTVPQGIQPA